MELTGNWCLKHPLCGGFETSKLDAAVVSLKVVIEAQIFFCSVTSSSVRRHWDVCWRLSLYDVINNENLLLQFNP